MVGLLDSRVGRRWSQKKLNVGCWNMRTLVEFDGSIFTGVSRQGGRGVTVDRKALLMVQELRKFGLSVVGISDTKWFGNAIYDVDGFLILHSGCPVPGVGERVERNEGVWLVLDLSMAERWRECGEVWSPVSSRIVMARLKLCDKARSLRGRSVWSYCECVCTYS